jgi:hypothetical protein
VVVAKAAPEAVVKAAAGAAALDSVGVVRVVVAREALVVVAKAAVAVVVPDWAAADAAAGWAIKPPTQARRCTSCCPRSTLAA